MDFFRGPGVVVGHVVKFGPGGQDWLVLSGDCEDGVRRVIDRLFGNLRVRGPVALLGVSFRGVASWVSGVTHLILLIRRLQRAALPRVFVGYAPPRYFYFYYFKLKVG